MDIRQRLIELQQQHGWSDYKIAKEAGLSPNTVSNIYRRGNTPSMVTLEALCKAFGITMADHQNIRQIRQGERSPSFFCAFIAQEMVVMSHQKKE